jgi:acetyl esterase
MSLTHSDALEARRTTDVDPDIRRFHQIVSDDYASHGDFDTLSLPEARRAAERVRARWSQGGPPMAETLDRVVPVTGTPIRVHVPGKSVGPAPALIYVHGGGWTLFSIDTHDRLMREYAARSGVTVVGIEYSLAPEAKFPRQIDEIVELVAMLRQDGEALGIDPDRIAIGGDSAGANLSVAANLALRDAGSRPLAAMLLNYGAFGPKHTPSYDRFSGPDYMLTGDEMDLFWQNYVRDERDFGNPLAAPLIADLRDMPPSFFTIAECDILVDGNYEMAERLKRAGSKAIVASFPGATHSFLEAVSIAEISDRALDAGSQWLKGVMSG